MEEDMSSRGDCYDPQTFPSTSTFSFTGNDSTQLTIPIETTWTINEYLDWLPPACKWKKQIPIWHLKRSYQNA